MPVGSGPVSVSALTVEVFVEACVVASGAATSADEVVVNGCVVAGGVVVLAEGVGAGEDVANVFAAAQAETNASDQIVNQRGDESETYRQQLRCII